MPDNYDFDEPELEGDVAVDKDIRRWMRNSYEATARLREASARRAEFEGKVAGVRRVRFDMRPNVNEERKDDNSIEYSLGSLVNYWGLITSMVTL